MQDSTVTKEEAEETREVGKGKFLLIMTKEDETDIEVETPKNIRMGFFQTLMAVRFGLPPFDVNPTDWKGLAHIGGAFALMLVCASLNEIPFFIALGLGLLAYNFYITQNYFRHFIRRKLNEGYTIKNEEHMKKVEDADAVPSTKEENNKIKKRNNIIIGVIILLSIIFLFTGGSNIDVVKESVLAYDDTVTIANAFEQYSDFKETSWEAFTTAKDQEVVEFRGELDFDDFIFPDADSNYSDFNLELIAQFTFTVAGDSFSLDYGCIEGTVNDNGETKIFNLDMEPEEILDLIYQNGSVFNMTLFNSKYWFNLTLEFSE